MAARSMNTSRETAPQSRRQPQQPKKRKSKTSPLIVIIFLVMTATFLFNFVRFTIQKNKLEAERDEILKNIQEQEELQQMYLEELSRVGTKEYYEYLARKHLGYIYPDEKVIITVEPDAN